MSFFEDNAIPVEDLRSNQGMDLLASADVVIAVDENQHEDVVLGQEELETAIAAGDDGLLVVLKVEIDSDLDDFEWLAGAVERVKAGDSAGEGDFED